MFRNIPIIFHIFFSKGNDLLLWFARLFLTAPSGNKKLLMDGGISDSWSQVLRWCVGGGPRTMAGSLMKVHHPMRKISWKTPKPKVDFQKVVEFFVSFSAFWWPGVIDLLVTWRLERGEGLQYWINRCLCDGSNRKSHHLRFVWCGFRWFCYSFMHLRFFGGAHEASWCAARNVLAPCYVASSARHYAHVQPSALDRLRAKTVTCGLWRGLQPSRAQVSSPIILFSVLPSLTGSEQGMGDPSARAS